MPQLFPMGARGLQRELQRHISNFSGGVLGSKMILMACLVALVQALIGSWFAVFHSRPNAKVNLMLVYWQNRSFRGCWILLLVWSLAEAGLARADEITVTIDGKDVAQSGSVKYENDELVILETSQGHRLRLPKSDIKVREAKPAPPYLTPDELGKALEAELKVNPHVRVKVTPDVITVLVLEAELPKEYEDRSDKVLDQITKSYDQAKTAVQQFAKKNKLPQKKPAVPAVVVVYESDSQAETRYDERDDLPGVSFLINSGWYDPTTNVATFSLPAVLGEEGTVADVLIWQQLFHTDILQRQAPVPLWFLQGVAAGFDWTGNKIEPDHLKLSSVTFPGLQEAKLVDWDKMATDYGFYENSDTFYFSDFRDQAWGLHWYLIGKNRAGYSRYWKTMAALSPLDEYSTEKSLADFKKAFGKNPEAFKPLFSKVFETAARTPPPSLEPEEAFIPLKENYGAIKLIWIDEAVQNNEVRMDGKLTNVSPLRPRSFCVGFSTNWGKSASWFVDDLAPSKTVELKVLRAVDPPADRAVKKAAKEGEHEVSNYWIKSVLSDSPEAAKWRKGELPPPPDIEE